MSDTEDFFEYFQRQELEAFVLTPLPKTLAQAEAEVHYCREMFRKSAGIYWSIVMQDTGKMVGAIGLYPNNQHNRMEVSYDLSPDYWRRGIMTKALKVATEVALSGLQVGRVEATTVLFNTASQELLRKCGYHEEGILKNYKWYNGQAHDVNMFARINPALSAPEHTG